MLKTGERDQFLRLQTERLDAGLCMMFILGGCWFRKILWSHLMQNNLSFTFNQTTKPDLTQDAATC